MRARPQAAGDRSPLPHFGLEVTGAEIGAQTTERGHSTGASIPLDAEPPPQPCVP